MKLKYIIVLAALTILTFCKNKNHYENSDSKEIEETTVGIEKTTIASQPKNIEFALKEFYALLINKDDAINNFISSEVEFILIVKPGAIHAGRKNQKVQHLDLKIKVPKLFNEIPDGHLCDGFFGAEDGMYYYSIEAENLPEYMYNVEFEKLSLPEKYKDAEIFEVLLIQNHFIESYFYFAQIDGEWVLICQKFSDCMA